MNKYKGGGSVKLCIGIIEDALGRPAPFKNYTNIDNVFNLERSEIYCGQPVLKSGIIYVASSEALPDIISIQNGAAMLCIGVPSEIYTKSPLLLLVLNADHRLDELSNKVTAIFSEYNKLEYELLEAVNKGRRVQYLVDLMSPYLNQNELLVNTNEFRFLGDSSQYCRLCEVSGIPQPNFEVLPQEVVTFFKNDIIWNNLKKITEPFIYEPSIFSANCLCMNVFYCGEFACRVVISEDRNPYRSYDAGLLRFFTSFIQLIYDMSEYHNVTFSKDHALDMFTELLNGENVERWRLENSLTQRDWNISGPYLLASIMPSERDYFNRTIPYYCQSFNRDFKGCCLFEYKDSIACVVNLSFYDSSPEKFSIKYLETFRDANFRVGYSNTFTDIMELQSYYSQAVIALRIGLRNFPSIWHHKFSDMLFYYLQSKMTEELDGRYLRAPEIQILMQYDKENHSDYFHTLKVYLENEMNTLKTAKDLYVHRATMEYRLKRIGELTGIDFNDADRVLYLRMSIMFFAGI